MFSPNISIKTAGYYPICRDRMLLSIDCKNNVDQQKQDYIASFNTSARNGRKQPNAVTRALSRRTVPT